MITESITLTGKVNIIHLDQFGDTKDEIHIDNLVVTAGKTVIASRLAGNTSPIMSRMGVGTGVAAATIADTSLGTAIAAGNVVLDSTSASTNTITYVATFPAGTGTGAITEAGIFNGFPGVGSMLCRTVFSAVNKAAGDVIVITWVVSVS
jgi:hypothetical protein